MTVLFQALLIIFGLLLFGFILIRIVKSKIIFTDFNYWLFFILFLIVLAVFPHLPYFIAHLIGVYSETNTVFFLVIAMLILLTLSLSFRVSQLNRKIIELTQRIAVFDYEHSRKQD